MSHTIKIWKKKTIYLMWWQPAHGSHWFNEDMWQSIKGGKLDFEGLNLNFKHMNFLDNQRLEKERGRKRGPLLFLGK